MVIMPTVLIAVLPAKGHVGPALPAAAALLSAGHEVRVLTGRRYASAFRELGAVVDVLPPESDFDDSNMSASRPEREQLRGVRLARYDLTNFVTAMRAQLSAIDELSEGVDVIICDPLLMAGLPLSMRARRPAVLVLGFIPFLAPFPGLPPATSRCVALHDRALAFVAGRVVAPVQQTAAQHVRELTGQEPPTLFMEWPLLADEVLQLSCPGFERSALEAAVPVDFLGPLSVSSSSEHPLPSWWGELDTDPRPVVLVTQGSIANDDLDALMIPTLRALADEDVLVIAGTGGSELPARAMADNVRVADWLPYDELLPRCAAMVTNGGYGGVQHALRHGVPLLCVGASEDKRAVAMRVQRTGVGIGLGRPRIGRRTAHRAVRRLLTEPEFRRRAGELAAEIAQTPGAAGLVTAVERHAH